MLVAIVLFAIAAAGGLTLAVLRLRSPNLPLPLAALHGAFAAAGLVVLALAVFGGSSAPSSARIALAVFVVAALGGAFLVSFQLRKRPIPVGIMALHALLAVSAFTLLVVGFASGR
jgi:hypothetical protein